MGKLLSEEKVLKKLDIVDFRHLTKDKVIRMSSLLDKMNPEVAKKALEQFPEFSSTMKELLNAYKDTLDKNVDANNNSTQSYYDLCNSIITSLQQELNKDNLTFEDKKYIFEKMFEIEKSVGSKDLENKKFLTAITSIGAVAVGVVAIALASALGGNTNIEIDD